MKRYPGNSGRFTFSRRPERRTVFDRMGMNVLTPWRSRFVFARCNPPGFSWTTYQRVACANNPVSRSATSNS